MKHFKQITPVLFLLLTYPAYGQEKKEIPKLGSVDQVENRMELDDADKESFFELGFLSPYFNFKKNLKEKSGFGFGLDYTAAYFGSNSKIGEGQASSGMVRLYGSWDLVGRNTKNTGALVYKFEHRHKYGAIPLQGLGFDVGFVGMILPPFSDQGFRTTNLYWRQRLAEGRVSFVAGFLDVTDFFDVYALASPWMHFSNFTFSTGVSAINVPNDAYLGAAISGWITDNVYAIAGIADVNSDPTNFIKGFETLFSKGETYKHLEFGVSSSKEYMLLDNIHISLWQKDAMSETGDPSGWGFVLSGTKYVGGKFFPFARFAYTKDGGSLLQSALAAGLGFQPNPKGGLLSLGYSWGKVNETTFAPGLKDQHVVELFYRIQVSQKIAITPDLQFIVNPALNDQQTSLFMAGVRGRIVL